jgi:hypothetical protein
VHFRRLPAVFRILADWTFLTRPPIAASSRRAPMELGFGARLGKGLRDVCFLDPFVFLSVASLALVLAAKTMRSVHKARNAAADSWKLVSATAAKNKVAPNIGIDELPADKKGPTCEAWGTSKNSDMIASSFLYEKITWNTADPALAKSNAAFDGYFAKDRFKTFALQLQDGNDKYKAAAASLPRTERQS